MSSPKKILDSVQQRFCEETKLTPLLGAELEFYILSDKEIQIDDLTEASGYPVVLEKGEDQFEIALPFYNDALSLASEIVVIKQRLVEWALRNGAQAFFDAKPFLDRPGSALHIHINACDQKGFYPFEKQGENESEVLLYAVGGLLATMSSALHFFAPTDLSMRRFAAGQESPSMLSWGGNNRTVALRIPTVGYGQENKRRIEHRVPGADADPYMTLACILEGVRQGVVDCAIPRIPKVYGNAWDEQYQLSPLKKSSKKLHFI